MTSVVTIGGGTGQFTLLSGLKKYPVKLTAIVSMADDGGSTGVLRDELGVLPPGDIRQCLVALSESETVMRELFNYRFDSPSAKASGDKQGGLHGHNFGNLFLSALEKITGSFEEAIRVSGKVLATRGEVVPVTTKSISLVCGKDGDLVCGEHAINSAQIREPGSLRIEPTAYANPKAVAAIEAADCIVIGPGNLYCSIIPNFLVRGLPEAIRRSRASVVYNCNLMTKKGHTEGYSVGDFVREVERYIGAGRINYVTYNDASPTKELLERYAAEGEPVRIDDGLAEGRVGSFTPLAADLVNPQPFAHRPGDPIRRTLIRHNADLLAAIVVQQCLAHV